MSRKNEILKRLKYSDEKIILHCLCIGISRHRQYTTLSARLHDDTRENHQKMVERINEIIKKVRSGRVVIV